MVYPVINNQHMPPSPNLNPNTSYPCNAIWDTGATNTAITKKIAQSLQLIPVTKTNVLGVHGHQDVNVYLVGMILPNNVGIRTLRVTECESLSHPDDPDPCDVLIGMDIISMGDLAITNVAGQTMFSFRIPSIKRVDFTKDEVRQPASSTSIIKPALTVNPNPFQGTGRNTPCPCGSGKKYKHCHGK